MASQKITRPASPKEALLASLDAAMKAGAKRGAVRACYEWARQQQAAGVHREEILAAIAVQALEEGAD